MHKGSVQSERRATCKAPGACKAKGGRCAMPWGGCVQCTRGVQSKTCNAREGAVQSKLRSVCKCPAGVQRESRAACKAPGSCKGNREGCAMHQKGGAMHKGACKAEWEQCATHTAGNAQVPCTKCKCFGGVRCTRGVQSRMGATCITRGVCICTWGVQSTLVGLEGGLQQGCSVQMRKAARA